MRIKKTPPKRLSSPNIAIKHLVKKLEKASDSELPHILNSFQDWTLPKADLYHFISILNRFDAFLEHFVQKYQLKCDKREGKVVFGRKKEDEDIKGKKKKDDDEKKIDKEDKRMILGILKFTRLLMENSMNRNLYHSYEWLNDLLLVNDLEILEATLFALVHPAKRIQQQRALRNAFVIHHERLLAFVKAWGSKENGFKMSQFLTYQHQNVSCVFSSGTSLISIHQNHGKMTQIEMFEKLVKEHSVKEEFQFQLWHQIRLLWHLNSFEEKKRILNIRYLLSETSALNQLFTFEPQLTTELGDLIQTDTQIPFEIQTSAFYGLEAVGQYRGRLADVLTAVNASASHGILMFLLRQVISNQTSYPIDFIDALFSLLASLLVSQSGGNMIVGAGIIPILVQIFKSNEQTQSKIVTKALSILDNLLYSYNQSFQIFTESNGTDLIVQRLHDELTICIELSKKDLQPRSPTVPSEQIPYERIALFKAMLRFMIHMMQTSSTSDRVRNLVESSLPDTTREILKNAHVFGAVIYAMGLNLMAAFIHNEPTSYVVLEEKKLIQAFFDTLSKDELTPSSDLLSAIPNVIGAICLNQSGLDKMKQLNPFPHFFAIFYQPEHLRSLLDEDISSYLGQSFDELVRHHPALRPLTMEALVEMLKKIIQMGEEMQIDYTDNSGNHINLLDDDIKEIQFLDHDYKAEDVKDIPLANYIETSSRFMEGFFQTNSHCKEFMKAGGTSLLLKIYTLPVLSFDFASSPPSYSISHILRLMSENDTAEVLTQIVKELMKAFEKAKWLHYSGNDSLFAPFVYLKSIFYFFILENDPRIEEANQILHSFTSLHSLVGVLSDVYSSPIFSNSKTSQQLIQMFTQPDCKEVLSSLGLLYRFCALESLFLKSTLPKYLLSGKRKLKILKNTLNLESKENYEMPDPNDSRFLNAKYFKYLLSQSTAFIVPIFQGIAKILLQKRADVQGKVNATIVCNYLVESLLEHLNWERCPNNSSTSSSTKNEIKFHYLQIIGSLIHTVLTDERNEQILLTAVAVIFQQQGGLELVFKILSELAQDLKDIQQSTTTTTATTTTIAMITKEDEEENHSESVLKRASFAFEKYILILFLLVQSKSIHDSQHTQILTHTNHSLLPKPTPTELPPHYSAIESFNPYLFIIEMRHLIMNRILDIWKEYRDVLPSSCLQVMIRVMEQVMKGDGEESKDSLDLFKSFLKGNKRGESSASGGGETSAAGASSSAAVPAAVPATGATGTAPTATGNTTGNTTTTTATGVTTYNNTRPIRIVTQNELRIRQLVEMGFSRSGAENALRMNQGNLLRAAEWLLMYPDIDPSVDPFEGRVSGVTVAGDAGGGEGLTGGNEGAVTGGNEGQGAVTGNSEAVTEAVQPDQDVIMEDPVSDDGNEEYEDMDEDHQHQHDEEDHEDNVEVDNDDDDDEDQEEDDLIMDLDDSDREAFNAAMALSSYLPTSDLDSKEKEKEKSVLIEKRGVLQKLRSELCGSLMEEIIGLLFTSGSSDATGTSASERGSSSGTSGKGVECIFEIRAFLVQCLLHTYDTPQKDSKSSAAVKKENEERKCEKVGMVLKYCRLKELLANCTTTDAISATGAITTSTTDGSSGEGNSSSNKREQLGHVLHLIILLMNEQSLREVFIQQLDPFMNQMIACLEGELAIGSAKSTSNSTSSSSISGGGSSGGSSSGTSSSDWMVSALLLLEYIISSEETVRDAEPDQGINTKEVVRQGKVDKSRVLQICLGLLTRLNDTNNTVNSTTTSNMEQLQQGIYRLLICLSRTPQQSNHLFTSNTNLLPLLLDFNPLNAFAGITTLSNILVRHLFENLDGLFECLVERELVLWMTTPREKVVEIGTVMKQMMPLLSRSFGFTTTERGIGGEGGLSSSSTEGEGDKFINAVCRVLRLKKSQPESFSNQFQVWLYRQNPELSQLSEQEIEDFGVETEETNDVLFGYQKRIREILLFTEEGKLMSRSVVEYLMGRIDMLIQRKAGLGLDKMKRELELGGECDGLIREYELVQYRLGFFIKALSELIDVFPVLGLYCLDYAANTTANTTAATTSGGDSSSSTNSKDFKEFIQNVFKEVFIYPKIQTGQKSTSTLKEGIPHTATTNNITTNNTTTTTNNTGNNTSSTSVEDRMKVLEERVEKLDMNCSLWVMHFLSILCIGESVDSNNTTAAGTKGGSAESSNAGSSSIGVGEKYMDLKRCILDCICTLLESYLSGTSGAVTGSSSGSGSGRKSLSHSAGGSTTTNNTGDRELRQLQSISEFLYKLLTMKTSTSTTSNTTSSSSNTSTNTTTTTNNNAEMKDPNWILAQIMLDKNLLSTMNECLLRMNLEMEGGRYTAYSLVKVMDVLSKFGNRIHTANTTTAAGAETGGASEGSKEGTTTEGGEKGDKKNSLMEYHIKHHPSIIGSNESFILHSALNIINPSTHSHSSYTTTSDSDDEDEEDVEMHDGEGEGMILDYDDEEEGGVEEEYTDVSEEESQPGDDLGGGNDGEEMEVVVRTEPSDGSGWMYHSHSHGHSHGQGGGGGASEPEEGEDSQSEDSDSEEEVVETVGMDIILPHDLHDDPEDLDQEDNDDDQEDEDEEEEEMEHDFDEFVQDMDFEFRSLNGEPIISLSRRPNRRFHARVLRIERDDWLGMAAGGGVVGVGGVGAVGGGGMMMDEFPNVFSHGNTAGGIGLGGSASNRVMSLNDAVGIHPLLRRDNVSGRERRESDLGVAGGVGVSGSSAGAGGVDPSQALMFLEQILNIPSRQISYSVGGGGGGEFSGGMTAGGAGGVTAGASGGSASGGAGATGASGSGAGGGGDREQRVLMTDFIVHKSMDRWWTEHHLFHSHQSQSDKSFDRLSSTHNHTSTGHTSTSVQGMGERVKGVQERIVKTLLPMIEREEKAIKVLRERERVRVKEERERKEREQAASASANASGSGVTSGGGATATTTATTESSSTANTIQILGTTLDLTDSGLDREFLEALPDDLRAEVLAQHFREQVLGLSTGGMTLPSSMTAVPSIQSGQVGQMGDMMRNMMQTELSAEFLEALPEDIRDLILQQESSRQLEFPLLQQGQRTQSQQRVSRLWDPPLVTTATSTNNNTTTINNNEGKEKEKEKKVINLPPLLDPSQQSSFHSLLKLLFIPQNFNMKQNWIQLCMNLCENWMVRRQFMHSLLYVLVEMSEHSTITSTTTGATTHTTTTTGTATGEKKYLKELLKPLSVLHGLENVLQIGIGRVLEVMLEISIRNPDFCTFFLEEYSTTTTTTQTPTTPSHSHSASSHSHSTSGISKSLGKKGKYPIVLLLGMMEKRVFLQNGGLLENLTQLIVSLTKPLA